MRAHLQQDMGHVVDTIELLLARNAKVVAVARGALVAHTLNDPFAIRAGHDLLRSLGAGAREGGVRLQDGAVQAEHGLAQQVNGVRAHALACGAQRHVCLVKKGPRPLQGGVPDLRRVPHLLLEPLLEGIRRRAGGLAGVPRTLLEVLDLLVDLPLQHSDALLVFLELLRELKTDLVHAGHALGHQAGRALAHLLEELHKREGHGLVRGVHLRVAVLHREQVLHDLLHVSVARHNQDVIKEHMLAVPHLRQLRAGRLPAGHARLRRALRVAEVLVHVRDERVVLPRARDVHVLTPLSQPVHEIAQRRLDFVGRVH
mmetsp:Transcript_24490/g.68653  ORF Transcript_24490/g.68653 Transcript_24490/m.68653 type:complete len:315 (+) Transcript_24490:436-1380(+)